MKAYSQDLRARIITAIEAGEDSRSEITDNFGVSLSFVEKLYRRWRQTGSCSPLPAAGGRNRLLKEDQALIRAEVAKQPDATLAELCERVAQAGGASASLSQMCRELNRKSIPMIRVANVHGKDAR